MTRLSILQFFSCIELSMNSWIVLQKQLSQSDSEFLPCPAGADTRMNPDITSGKHQNTRFEHPVSLKNGLSLLYAIWSASEPTHTCHG